MTASVTLDRLSRRRGGSTPGSEENASRLSPASGSTEEDLTDYRQVGRKLPSSTLREPLPVLTLALTRHFGCVVGISRRPQAR